MIVNGQPFDLQLLQENTIEHLLNHFKLTKTRVALEINGKILKKADYPTVQLNNEDQIEIIHFAGGG